MFYGIYEKDGNYYGGVYSTPQEYKMWQEDTSDTNTNIVALFDFNSHGKTYAERKSDIRGKAIEYSNTAGLIDLSWYEYSLVTSFFDIYGRRYHLMEEFRENGIC